MPTLQNKKLRLNKTEQNKLQKAAEVCDDIAKSSMGYHKELSEEAAKIVQHLERLIVEEIDLTKPF